MKTSLVWLGLFVVLFLVLAYVAEFSFRQSIVLSFVVIGLHASLAELKARKRVPFVPYSLLVRPNFHAILTDFGLIQDTKEDWAKLWGAIESLPKSPWNIWKSGLSNAFITPELKYRQAWNDFRTEVDVYASLEPVVTLPEGRNREVNPNVDCPSLRLLPGNYGYRLVLRLRDWYWDKVKQRDSLRNIKESDVSHDRICGAVDVTIAVIPYQEFDVYAWADPGEPTDDSIKRYKNVVQTRAEARLRYGWKGEPKRDEYGRETTADFSDELEHKYFTLTHTAL